MADAGIAAGPVVVADAGPAAGPVVVADAGIAAGPVVVAHGGLAEMLAGVLVNVGMQATGGALVREVPVRVTRRGGHAVDARRVVPVPSVPGGGIPVRHKAECRQRGYREDGNAIARVAVHGATVGVAEDGEAVGIVAGVRPGNAGAVAIRGVGDGVVAAVGEGGAGAQQQRGGCQSGDGGVFDFHDCCFLWLLC